MNPVSLIFNKKNIMFQSSSTAHILAELTLGEREKALSERYLRERDDIFLVFYIFLLNLFIH
jgi:hypothetical protein